MLVLSRRSQESIQIQDSITVHVLSIQGNQVRLGIQAPPDVSVYRMELYLKIQEGKKRQESEEDNLS